jgi:transposase
MKQKYHVKLSEAERTKLKKQKESQKVSLEAKKRAHALLELDESNEQTAMSSKKIAAKVGLSAGCIDKYRKQYATSGLEKMKIRKKRESPPVPAKVTGEVEAHIIAVACSEPPDGRSEWTMQMIANKIVLEGIVESISDETVRRVLKKQN